MDTFTASNGKKISDSDVFFEGKSIGAISLSDAEITALREFFQAEADERLGRWRWPENPQWLVKYIGEHMVIVVRESEFWENVGKQGQFNQFHFRDARNHGAELSDKAARYKRAAWAFFEAHPDLTPKPWHEAKPGEVWELTLEGEEPAAFYPSKSLDGCFTPVKPNTGTTAINFDWPLITAGRRIWPEVLS